MMNFDYGYCCMLLFSEYFGCCGYEVVNEKNVIDGEGGG